ncbi:unnamed protein product [Thlaspi arvense]|uniref:F-box domain-containing protein n=1 Tax=Thlaspi arvense TaxID=13288 RepID=A0AAU9T1B2_THLAR|nr:unnamed protein product [Thlaspi arvense]
MSSKARSSAATKKKKKPSPATEPTSISILSLPNDVLLNCLARVPILYYPILSLVSKTFRSMIASSELYETRSRLNRTEKRLYLCIYFPLDPVTRWFTLCRLPDRNLTNKSSGYLMQEIPSPKYISPERSSTLVAVGSNVYKIGGADIEDRYTFWKRVHSSSVAVLDCRSHTWRNAPSMRMKRSSSSTASLLDGKIYVAGGCKDKYVHHNSPDWIEAFDTVTQTWGSVKNPRVFELHHEFRDKPFVAGSFPLEGKLYMFGDTFAVYHPEEDRWDDLRYDYSNYRMSWGARSSHCVIDDVLYFWNSRVLEWYDIKASLWKEVKDLEILYGPLAQAVFYDRVKLVI